MLYLTCTTITSADLAHNGVYSAKDWVSVNCGTIQFIPMGQLLQQRHNVFSSSFTLNLMLQGCLLGMILVARKIA